MTESSISVCPRCQQRFMRMPYTGDYEHNCFGSEVLQNDSILILGDYTDYTTTGSLGPVELTIDLLPLRGTTNVTFICGSVTPGQSFILDTPTKRLTNSIALPLNRSSGFPAGLQSEYVILSLRDTISGTDLATGSIRAGSISTVTTLSSSQWITFPINQIELDTKTKYYIVASFDSGVNIAGSRINWYNPVVQSSNFYIQGNSFTTTNKYETITENIYSRMFRVYTIEPDVSRNPLANQQGTENKLFGTRAQLEGAKEEQRDSRGYPSDRFRSRQHIHPISADTFKKTLSPKSDDPEVYEE